MGNVILFGATGNLGREIARALVNQGHRLTVVVRDASRLGTLEKLASKVVVAEATLRTTLDGVLRDQDIVVSALGKSVSPRDMSKPGFRAVDYRANLHILDEARKASVRKFVYISAYHAEAYLHLEYFKVHHDFSEVLRLSGIDYSIIKPPAMFSAFREMIDMARKGQLVSIGKGDKLTNPIYEGDLAKIAVDSIGQPNCIIEAGGKTVYSRRQLLEIVQSRVDGRKKIREVPIGMVKLVLPLIRLASRNTFDKFAFFLAVMEKDTIAPQIGAMRFEDYIDSLIAPATPGTVGN